MDNITRFNRYITALQQYITREGNALVPANHIEIVGGDSIHLGTWVGYMRQRNKTGKLSETQKSALDSINGWNWGPLKPGPKDKRERNSEIAQMRNNGKSLAQIADQYNLSRQRVHQIVRRLTTA
jgi:DNA-binding NarL/FixJ family response regulator